MATVVAPPARSSRTGFAPRVLMLIGSGAGNQTGAAIGAHAFGAIGPLGVVAMRQVIAAIGLLSATRPALRTWTRREWLPTAGLAVVFLVMNSSLYEAVDRIGLGLAVTLEFLGPLLLALALSRTARDLCCALGAGVGVWVLVLPGPSSDYLGVALALLAAVCWACYILLNRALGRRLPAIEAPAVASGMSSMVAIPYLVVLAVSGRLTGHALLLGAAAGVLCSVVPYAADVIALRRLPAAFFGVFMSINPVLAALAGLVVLGQVLGTHEWVGIVLIVAANVTAAIPAARRAAADQASLT